MLDECKGDKVEEALAAFSTIVLHKFVAAKKHGGTSAARRLALMASLSCVEQESLLPLAIAHRASLTNILRKKSKLRLKYQEFHRLLNDKEEELSQKKQNAQFLYKGNDGIISKSDKIQDIQQQFEIHWQGDPRWKDILLNGDRQDSHDPLLDIPFSKIRSHILDGSLPELDAASHQSLVQNLEMRVKSQAARLERWKTFRDELVHTAMESRNSSQSGIEPRHSTGVNLDFSRHEDLNFDSKNLQHKSQKKSRPHGGSVSYMIEEYERLINSMRRDLASSDQTVNNAAGHQQLDADSRTATSKANERILFKEPNRTLSKLSSDLENDSQLAVNVKTNTAITTNGTSGSTSTDHVLEPPLSSNTSSNYHLGAKAVNHLQPNGMGTIAKAHMIEADEDEPFIEPTTLSTTNSGTSSPGPKLSLVQRTRKSMALASPGDLYSTHMQTLLPTAGPKSKPTATFDSRETLLERTRQSMSLLPTNPRPSRQSLYPYPQQPLQPYPTNQFDTPRKSRPSDTQNSTPPEQIFSQDANYASVFKSRPKIALSPTLSPTVDESQDSISLAGSHLGEDRNMLYTESSPLSRFASKIGLS